MANIRTWMKGKKTFIPIFLILIVVIGALAFYLYYQNAPARVISVSAKLGGDNDLIVVQFQTSKEMASNYNANQAYLIVQGSNKTLYVKRIPKIGSLITQSAGTTSGWFVINNADLDVKDGTLVTIVIGDFRQEGYRVTSQ